MLIQLLPNETQNRFYIVGGKPKQVLEEERIHQTLKQRILTGTCRLYLGEMDFTEREISRENMRVVNRGDEGLY